MSAAKAPDPPDTVEARCVRLPAKADDAASLAPVIERRMLSRAAGAVLKELVPGFASGHLEPFPILSGALFPLEDAKASSSRDCVILRPSQ